LQDEEGSLSDLIENDSPRIEHRGFSHDELIPCEKCKRVNPPTRANCLYCGSGLPVSDTAAQLIRPSLRQLEDWESGFNLVRLPGESIPSNTELRKLTDLLRQDVEFVRLIFSSGVALPLARCASREEAEVVQARLTDLGVQVLIVSDAELDAHPIKRVRTLELVPGSMVLCPIGRKEKTEIPWQEITLLVVGRRIVRRLEVAERTDKRRGKEVVASRELSTDAERLDIFSNKFDDGWRVAADNFDFSCLGELKTMIASKNFQILAGVLRDRAPQADYDDSYLRARNSLSLVWPLEQRTESLGLHKPRMGKINTGAATTSDNELQFTRYSRLLHRLKLRRLGLNI
jgi:hypothetical protein